MISTRWASSAFSCPDMSSVSNLLTSSAAAALLEESCSYRQASFIIFGYLGSAMHASTTCSTICTVIMRHATQMKNKHTFVNIFSSKNIRQDMNLDGRFCLLEVVRIGL